LFRERTRSVGHVEEGRFQDPAAWQKTQWRLRLDPHALAPPRYQGTEWLLIKKQDDAVVKGYDIDQYDESALTTAQHGRYRRDTASKHWTSSRPASRGAVKAPWLADAIAKLTRKAAKN